MRRMTEVLVLGVPLLISLSAFASLILAPAMGSFARGWEKTLAALLSLVVLCGLVAAGVAFGVAIVHYWPQLSKLLS